MLEIKVVTLITAFGIAFVKAYLVAKNFMHINLTPRFVIYTVTTTLVFMLLFFAGTAPDVMKSHGTNWEKPAWIAAEKAYAAGDIVGASLGARIQEPCRRGRPCRRPRGPDGSGDGHEGADTRVRAPARSSARSRGGRGEQEGSHDDAHVTSPPIRLISAEHGEPRVISNGVLGMSLFVLTEIMLFAGMISVFNIVRASAIVWPPPGQPRLPSKRRPSIRSRSSRRASASTSPSAASRSRVPRPDCR